MKTRILAIHLPTLALLCMACSAGWTQDRFEGGASGVPAQRPPIVALDNVKQSFPPIVIREANANFVRTRPVPIITVGPQNGVNSESSLPPIQPFSGTEPTAPLPPIHKWSNAEPAPGSLNSAGAIQRGSTLPPIMTTPQTRDLPSSQQPLVLPKPITISNAAISEVPVVAVQTGENRGTRNPSPRKAAMPSPSISRSSSIPVKPWTGSTAENRIETPDTPTYGVKPTGLTIPVRPDESRERRDLPVVDLVPVRPYEREPRSDSNTEIASSSERDGNPKLQPVTGRSTDRVQETGRVQEPVGVQETREVQESDGQSSPDQTEPGVRQSPMVQPGQVMPESSIVMEPGFIEPMVGGSTLPTSPRAVLSAEALFMSREGGSVRFSDAFEMDPFDFELGIRIQAQRVFGADGTSITYSGIQEWNETRLVTSAGGGLGIRSIAGGGLAPTALAPFTGSNLQQQYHNGSIHTLELNRVTWAWDVINIFYGARITHYEEEFDFFSARLDGQQGLLSMDMENNIFGPQIGAEIFYDIGTRISTGAKFKLGATANAYDGETLLISNGTRVIDNSDTDVTLNFVGEMSLFFRARLAQRTFLRAGYDVWYNSALYSVDENLPGIITPALGSVTLDNDVFIHGAAVGFEIVW